ncbi:uncharacterized protein LOC120341031 [Styela clava]
MMELAENLWLYEYFVYSSLRRFVNCHSILENDLLTASDLLTKITKEYEIEKYDDKRGIHFMWGFVATVVEIKHESTADIVRSLQDGLAYLNSALKCKFSYSKDASNRFMKELRRVKAETIIQIIKVLLNNKSESRIVFNRYQESLSEYQQDSIKCVLLGLHDTNGLLCSFTEYVNIVAATVQKMLDIVPDPFIVNVANTCHEKLNVMSEEYQGMIDIYESDSNDDPNQELSHVEQSENLDLMQDKSNQDTMPSETFSASNTHDVDNSKPLCAPEKKSQPENQQEDLIKEASARPINNNESRSDVTSDRPKVPIIPFPNRPTTSKPNSGSGRIRGVSISKHSHSWTASSVISYSSTHKRQFNPVQDTYIIMGIQKFGTSKNKWKKTLDSFPFPEYRTASHLKDRWRTMLNKKEVTIVDNEVKLSNKYITLFKHLESKFDSNILSNKKKKITDFLDDKKSDKSLELNYSPPEVISDAESSTSMNPSDMECVKNWLETGTRVKKKVVKKAPALLQTGKKNRDLFTPESSKPTSSKTLKNLTKSSDIYVQNESNENSNTVPPVALGESEIHTLEQKKRDVAIKSKKYGINPQTNPNSSEDFKNTNNNASMKEQNVENKRLKKMSDEDNVSFNKDILIDTESQNIAQSEGLDSEPIQDDSMRRHGLDNKNDDPGIKTPVISDVEKNVSNSRITDSDMVEVEVVDDMENITSASTSQSQKKNCTVNAITSTNIDMSQSSQTLGTTSGEDSSVKESILTSTDQSITNIGNKFITDTTQAQKSLTPPSVLVQVDITGNIADSDGRNDENSFPSLVSTDENSVLGTEKGQREALRPQSPSASEYITAEEDSVKSSEISRVPIEESRYSKELNVLKCLDDADIPNNIEQWMENNSIQNFEDEAVNLTQDTEPSIEQEESSTKMTIKKEFIAPDNTDLNDRPLEPPPSEIILKNHCTFDNTPVLVLQKVKLESGELTTDVCILVNNTDEDSMLESGNNEGQNDPISSDVADQDTSSHVDKTVSPIEGKDKASVEKVVGIDLTNRMVSTSEVTAAEETITKTNSIKSSRDFQYKRKRKRKVILHDQEIPIKLLKEDEMLFPAETFNKDPSGIFLMTGKSRQGRRRGWTEEEDGNLLDGVNKYGEGNWKKILDEFDFYNRTAVNLKDRYRVLKMQ